MQKNALLSNCHNCGLRRCLESKNILFTSGDSKKWAQKDMILLQKTTQFIISGHTGTNRSQITGFGIFKNRIIFDW
jgi:hypothetical protein